MRKFVYKNSDVYLGTVWFVMIICPVSLSCCNSYENGNQRKINTFDNAVSIATSIDDVTEKLFFNELAAEMNTTELDLDGTSLSCKVLEDRTGIFCWLDIKLPGAVCSDADTETETEIESMQIDGRVDDPDAGCSDESEICKWLHQYFVAAAKKYCKKIGSWFFEMDWYCFEFPLDLCTFRTEMLLKGSCGIEVDGGEL